jgi:hypothetical protein
MTHGALILEKAPACAWLWDYATSVNNGVCLYAPEYFATTDPSVRRRSRQEQHWSESVVHRADGFGPGWRDTQYARYEPSWDGPFSNMCDECLRHIHSAIAVPLEASDEDARRTFNALHDVMHIYVELLAQRRRIRTVLALVPVSRWACAVGFTYESYCTLFLSSDAQVVADALTRIAEGGGSVEERW